METFEQADDGVVVRLTRDEATALYNLLVDVEAWPQGGGARPFIRQIREELNAAIEGLPGGSSGPS